MTIAGVWEKCKKALVGGPRDLLVLTVLILVALLAFRFGYLAGLGAAVTEGLSLNNSPLVDTSRDQRVIASKTGKKYHLSWCAGADRISGPNRLEFSSIEEAEAAGYTSAGNCPGL